MRTSCSAGVRPSGLRVVMPARTWPLRPATRTMKNSSRLLAEIDRKRTRSNSGWLAFCGFLEHAAIELQPRQFAVDKSFRADASSGLAEQAPDAGAAGTIAFTM